MTTRHDLPNEFRALADAEATAHLFIKMQQAIKAKLKVAEVDCKQFQAIEKQKICTS